MLSFGGGRKLRLGKEEVELEYAVIGERGSSSWNTL